MRVLVLGASGGCGRWLARIGSERGHQVTAVVRANTRFEAPADVVVVRGDVTDRDLYDRFLPGHDAVLSALGLRRVGRSPWALLLSPTDLVARTMRHLVPAMRQHGVSRVVMISAAGVGDSHAHLTWPVRRMVASGNVALAYRDLACAEAILGASDRDWLVVRPVTLMDGTPRRAARPVSRYGLTSTVRRSEVATWMLDAVVRDGPFAERRVTLGT